MFRENTEHKRLDLKSSRLLKNYEILDEDYQKMLLILSDSLVKYQKTGYLSKPDSFLNTLDYGAKL